MTVGGWTPPLLPVLTALAWTGGLALGLSGCGRGAPGPPPPATARDLPTPAQLEAHCSDNIGEARIEHLAERDADGPGIWLAIGWDLANTIVIETEDGLVVVDPGMSPTRAEPARAAFFEALGRDEPVRVVIYTHSHIDHVGGASAWVGADTRIVATDRFEPRFFAQYGRMLAAENARGRRQFGYRVHEHDLPCSALGRQVDLDAALSVGAVMPTESFTGETTLTVGGVTLELVEAHGETTDQLFVWLPQRRALLPGDNWYRAFPNLYTIRGTEPRPVDDWIDSLDRMRARAPALLIPSHTAPLSGEQEVAEALTAYRDGIQFVRDEVVRSANEGEPLDELTARLRLPEHLAQTPWLAELYGQVGWSARALYNNELGWFDGKASELYPLPPDDRATLFVEAMGGPLSVLARARGAIEMEPRWSIELLALLEDEGSVSDEELSPLFAEAYESLGGEVTNTNGRGYLLQAAHERRGGIPPAGQPELPADFVARIPLDQLFEQLPLRLRPDEALDVHETVEFRITEPDGTERVFFVTTRRGVAELARDTPLPGTPEPLGRLVTDGATWRQIALGQRTSLAAVLAGDLSVEGDRGALLAFMERFQRGLMSAPPELP